MSMAGYKGDLRHLAILGVLLAVLLYAAAVTLAEDDKIPFVWQGTVTLAQTQLTSPRGTGAITDRWVLSVRWKETQRIEVKDAGGSLIGWFVKLEDDSSSWQGETTGGYEMECRRGGVETRVESGEASGVGDVFTPGWGWLYYSASDEDPLASILPNGAYAFCSTSTSTQKYTVNWIRHGCPTSDGRVDVTRSTRPAYLHYKVGGRYMFEPFAAPGGFPGKFLPLQTAQAMASQRMSIPAAYPYDSRGRSISDGRMEGSASNSFHNAYTNTISWDIARVLDLKPVIKECKESWRPVAEGAAQGSDEITISASVPDQPDVTGKWRFTLMDVSCETGNCLNAGEETGLDLEFVRGQEGFEEPRTIRGDGASGTNSGSISSSSGSTHSSSGTSEGSGGAMGSLRQWESGASYVVTDMVLNDGNAYGCRLDHNSRVANEPGSGPEWGKYWAQGAGSGVSATDGTSDGNSSSGSTSGASHGGGSCGEDGGEEEIEGNETTNEVTVRIKSRDYGAWARLKAEINVDGVWYKARSEDDKDYITIPFDKDENHIADQWEQQYGVSGQAKDADLDEKPEGVGRESGDGFTNYEEYRGVKVHNAWTELDPGHKDLFIRDETGLGVGLLTDLGLHLHLIDEDEHENRVINFNRGFATLTSQAGQKGLLLKQEALDGLVGVVRPYVGSPNTVEEVVLNAFPADMADIYQEDYEATGGTIDSPNLQADIGHELAHGLNVLHHGLVPLEVLMGMTVAFPGGVWSGDMSCMMRYDSPTYYYHPGDNALYDYPADEEQGGAVRRRFCDSSTGTGVNAAGRKPHPVAGNAATDRGSCRKKVTLKGNHVRGD